MVVIVTGVAGYIGAHVAKALLENGHAVIGIDNLSTGRREFLDSRINFFKGDICDLGFLTEVFSQINDLTECGVVHCAGVKFPEESMTNPSKYFEINTGGTLNLLKVMAVFNVNSLVFSSSCSVYGNPADGIAVTETMDLRPVSPYGHSKMLAENAISTTSKHSELRAVSLRYFNVAGNSHFAAFDISPRNLLPNMYRAASLNSIFKVYGNDFPTPDGSCIRDYVHIDDLASAHVKTLKSIISKKNLSHAYNIGSGSGFSVLEILENFKRVSMPDFRFEFSERRAGDPSQISADISAAKSDLGWIPRNDLTGIISSGWLAWKQRWAG
jgi:UDP-glucose 4-epimerase